MSEPATALLPGEIKQLVRDADALIEEGRATLERFNKMIDRGEAFLESLIKHQQQYQSWMEK